MKKNLVFIAMLVFVNAHAANIYVSTIGSDGSNGLSWANAKLTISSAVSAAGTNGVIYIASGIYNISSPISLSAPRSFYGGYLVDGNFNATRPLKANGKPWEYQYETIINGTTFTGTNTDSKNSKLLHVGTTTAGNVIIDGITFQNGQGKNTSTSVELGGAISQSSGSPMVVKINDCIFRNNSVRKTDSSSGGIGGALYLRENAEVTNCYFSGNGAYVGSSGGGAIFSQPTATTSSVTILNCVFDGNLSNIAGSGIRTNGINKTTISSCTFVNNYAYDESTITYKNGAALYCSGTASGNLAPSTDEVNNCLFYNNTGSTSVLMNGGTMKNCSFVNNVGGFRTGYEGSGKIYNTVLWGNLTPEGLVAGFEFSKSPESIQYCASDKAISGSYTSNCITLSSINLTQSTGAFFKLPTTFSGNGDLSSENADWSIANASALKTAGNIAYAAGTTDLAGNNRPTSGSICTIGAYEYLDMSTYHFKSRKSGNWADYDTWEASANQSIWSISDAAPANAAASISISSSNAVSINDNATASSLTVKPTASLTLESDKTLATTSFMIESNASGTGTFVNDGTFTATTASVQQYLSSGRNWYISSPVTGATTTPINTETGSSVVSYDELHGTSAPWVTESSTLTPGKGYIVTSPVNANPTITFSGALNTGEKQISVTRTVGQTKEGFNLVGNPYPAHLAWIEATAGSANVLPSIWYRTAAYNAELSKYVYSFVTYNAPSGVSIPSQGSGGYIPPMQAFWVKANNGGGMLTFNSNMCSHQGSNPLKTPASEKLEQQLLRLQVSNGLNVDETVIYTNPAAIDNYDRFDTPKMSNNASEMPEIFTKIGAEELAINGMNSTSADVEIPLGFFTKETNDFSIVASEIRNFDSGVKIILKDKLENKEFDLGNNKAYEFNSDATKTTERFSVIFRTSGVSTDFNSTELENNISVYKNANNSFVLACNVELINGASVAVFNCAGQKILEQKLLKDNTLIPIPDFAKGVYLVKVNVANKNVTKKIVVN